MGQVPLPVLIGLGQPEQHPLPICSEKGKEIPAPHEKSISGASSGLYFHGFGISQKMDCQTPPDHPGATETTFHL